MPTNAPCASETWPRGHSGSASAGSGPEPPRRRRARSRRGGGSAAPSYGALLGAAEQALRPEQDDGDQEEQRDRGAVLGRDVGRGEIVDDAEEEPAGDRPAHLVEAADDGGDERRLPKHLAGGEFGEIDRRISSDARPTRPALMRKV